MKLSGPIAKLLDAYEDGIVQLMALGADQCTLDRYAKFCESEKALDKETGLSFDERNPEYALAKEM